MAKLARGTAGGGWKASLAAVLKAHNNAKVDGSVASHATRDKRADVLYAGFKLLREKGYKLDTVESFRGKHMEVLAKAWEARGLSPSTLQNHLSTFRIFAGWIGSMITLAFSRSSAWYFCTFCWRSCCTICGLTSSNLGSCASRTSSTRMMW